MSSKPQEYLSKEDLVERYFGDDLSELNKKLQIDGWSNVSKVLTYLSIIGVGLLALSWFFQFLWIITWGYIFVSIFVLGYLFTKPTQRYNWVLVLLILFFIAIFYTFYGQACLAMLDITSDEFTLSDNITQYVDDPLSNLGAPLQNLTFGGGLQEAMRHWMDWLNWLVILVFVVYIASAIPYVYPKLQIDKAIMIIAKAVIGILVMEFVYTLLSIVGVPIHDPAQTLMRTVDNILGSLGWASMMDMMYKPVGSLHSLANTVFTYLPLIFPFILLGLAINYRNDDIKSLLFVRTLRKDRMMKIKRAAFSIGAAVAIIVLGVYVVGFILMTSDAAVAISRPVILIFTIVAITVLILIGTGVLIINKKENIPETVVRFLKWSGIGIIALYLWFQIFQPAMAQLGLMNETNGLLVMGQGGIFDSNIFKQFFLVAMPETLIFQIGIIGIGNRIYFYFNKTRLREKREKKVKKQMEELEIRLNAVDQVLTKDPDSRENIERMARYISLRQKYDKLREEIESGKVTKLPKSYFILPTVISAIIGSFIFSTYHSFRRGMSFLLWWQLPTFGLTYFGAGFLLCFIAFFSWPAAIFVHTFNNVLALIMAGGGL